MHGIDMYQTVYPHHSTVLRTAVVAIAASLPLCLGAQVARCSYLYRGVIQGCHRMLARLLMNGDKAQSPKSGKVQIVND